MFNRTVVIASFTLLLALFLAAGFPLNSKTAGFVSPSGEALNSPPSALPHATGANVLPVAPARVASDLAVPELALHVARRNHTATALADGRVLIIGGDNRDGVVGDAEMLDLSSHTLSVVATSLAPRTQHTATLLQDGRVLVTGGAGQGGFLDSTEIFNPQSGSFSAGPRMQRARAGHSATLLANGMVLIAGGHADGSAEIYDPATNQSTLLNAKTTAVRKNHTALLLGDGSVLLAGGEGAGGHNLDSAETFNPVTLSFVATAAPMMIPRATPTLRTLPDGKVQVIGGDVDGTMEIYDPATRLFKAAAHLVPTADMFPAQQMLAAQTRAGFIDAISYRDKDTKQQTTQNVADRVVAFKQGVGRSLYAAAEIPALNQAVVAGGVDDDDNPVSSVLLLKSSAATISTDKVEYLPGRAPVITGKGWKPFEKVTIIRQEAKLSHHRITLEAVANAKGVFVSTALMPADYQPWVTYTLTARGESSTQVAQTTYYDAPPPDRLKQTFPAPFRFEIPITGRDGSAEVEIGLLRWRATKPVPQKVNRRGMTTQATVTCTPVANADFDLNTDFSSIVNQPCLNIPGDPCGDSDVQLTNGCFEFSGNFIVEGCFAGFGSDGCSGTYIKFGLDQKFAAHALFDISLKGDLNFEKDLFAIPGIGLSFNVADVLTGDAGATVKAKLEISATTETKFQASFDLTEGSEFGFDSRNSPAGYNTIKTPGVADGDVTLTELGESEAKLKLGPNLGFSLTAFKGSDFEIDLGGANFGVFGFLQATVTPTKATGTCKAGDVGLNAGVDIDSDISVADIVSAENSTTVFSVGIPGFPKHFSFGTDSTPPTITGISTFVVGTAPGTCTAQVSYSPTFDDDCSGVDTSSISIDPPSGSTFQKGTTTVNVSVKDKSGNLATTSFTVTVTDNEPPTFTSTATDVTQGTDANSCSAVVHFSPTATDVCDGSVTPSCAPPSGSTFAKGTTPVTCTATDSAGHQSAPYAFNVIVNDTQKPTLSLPSNMTQGTDANKCSAVVSYTATASDNCDSGLTPTCTPPSGSTFSKGATTVNCSAKDSSNNTANSSFTVTVNDTQKPAISTPGGVTQGTDLNKCSAVVTFATTTTDNCDSGLTATCVPPSGSTFSKGVMTVNCSVTDSSSNTGTASFTVTVNDTQKPQITRPADITVANVHDTCSAPVTYNPTVTDNCGVQSFACVPPSGTTFSVGTTTVTCTATDTSNNTSTCSFKVTVNDTQKPDMFCATLYRVAPKPGDSTAIVTYPTLASDNCALASVICVPPSGAAFPLGTTNVSCTATDVAGNKASCGFAVSLYDICLQDDSSANTSMIWNSVTGEYRYCIGGAVYTGIGKSLRRGLTFSLSGSIGQRITATLDATQFKGNAGLQVNGIVYTITDRDIRNNTCPCATSSGGSS